MIEASDPVGYMLPLVRVLALTEHLRSVQKMLAICLITSNTSCYACAIVFVQILQLLLPEVGTGKGGTGDIGPLTLLALLCFVVRELILCATSPQVKLTPYCRRVVLAPACLYV